MWNEPGLVLYTVDPTQYDLNAGELDAERLCGLVRVGGGTAIRLVVHSLRGYAYFPSNLAPLPPGHEFGRDYVLEFAEACRRHGLGLACSVSVAPNPALAAARPDWLQRGPDGQPHSWGRLPVMCPNTGYLTYVTDLVREVVARYSPECVCLDHFAHLDGCHCDGCAAALRQDTGLDLSAVHPGSPEALRYTQWRLERTERLAWSLAMAAKALRGDLHVVFGGCSWSPRRDRAVGWRPQRIIDWVDGLESPFGMWWYGHDTQEAELIGAYQRALGKPAWGWVEYGPLPYGLLASPPAELRVKAGLMVAAGCRPCVWVLPPTPPVEDRGLRALGRLFSQFEEQPDPRRTQGSFARTAVFLSEQVADAPVPDNDGVVRAWCQALSREHLLWDFVLPRDLNRRGLAPYRVLILPGTPYLSPEALETLEEFVRAGGSAVFVGMAGRHGQRGELLADSVVADLLGVRAAGAPDEAAGGSYLRVSELPLSELARQMLPVGPVVPVTTTSAEVIAEVIEGPEGPLALPSPTAARGPGITWRRLGGGRAVYVAAELQAPLLSSQGPRFPVVENLVGSLIRWLGGERVRIVAPRQAAVQVYRTETGATIHIVNRPDRAPFPIEHLAPLDEVTLAFPQTLFASGVRALDGSPVDWEQSGRRLRITSRDVTDYRCLVVEGALG